MQSKNAGDMNPEELARHQYGMKRAFMHAVDMNRDGTLSDKEIDDFRRYLLRHVLEDMSTDEYAQHRKSGALEKMHSDAGGAPDDYKLHPRDIEARHEAVGAKVVANFLEKLRSAGAIDDKRYIQEMESLKLVPDELRNSDKPPGDVAFALRDHMAGNDGTEMLKYLTEGVSDEPEPQSESYKIDPKYVSAFKKRQNKNKR